MTRHNFSQGAHRSIRGDATLYGMHADNFQVVVKLDNDQYSIMVVLSKKPVPKPT